MKTVEIAPKPMQSLQINVVQGTLLVITNEHIAEDAVLHQNTEDNIDIQTNMQQKLIVSVDTNNKHVFLFMFICKVKNTRSHAFVQKVICYQQMDVN